MAFDIRAIFARSLGGRLDRNDAPPFTADDEPDDDFVPASPIEAAANAAASPATDDMAQGGASASTALIPEGLAAMPSAAADETRAGLDDDSVDDDQAAAVAAIAAAAATISGPLSRERREDLVESLREVPGLEDFDRATLDDVLAALAPDADDFAARMEDHIDEVSGTLTDPVLRRAAYQLAVYFCAWDGGLDDDEADLLEALAEGFEISTREAASLRETTILDAALEVDAPSAGAP